MGNYQHLSPAVRWRREVWHRACLLGGPGTVCLLGPVKDFPVDCIGQDHPNQIRPVSGHLPARHTGYWRVPVFAGLGLDSWDWGDCSYMPSASSFAGGPSHQGEGWCVSVGWAGVADIPVIPAGSAGRC